MDNYVVIYKRIKLILNCTKKLPWFWTLEMLVCPPWPHPVVRETAPPSPLTAGSGRGACLTTWSSFQCLWLAKEWVTDARSNQTVNLTKTQSLCGLGKMSRAEFEICTKTPENHEAIRVRAQLKGHKVKWTLEETMWEVGSWKYGGADMKNE